MAGRTRARSSIIVVTVWALVAGLLPAQPSGPAGGNGRAPAAERATPPPGKVSGDAGPIGDRPTQEPAAPGSGRQQFIDRMHAEIAARKKPPGRISTPLAAEQQSARDRTTAARGEGLIRDDKDPPVSTSGPSLSALPHATGAPAEADPPLGTVRKPAPAPRRKPASFGGEAAFTPAGLSQYRATYAVAAQWDVAPSFLGYGYRWVRVYNTSSVTWPAYTVSLGYHLYRSDQSIVNYNGNAYILPFDMPGGYYVDIYAQTQPLAAGSYIVVYDMRDGSDTNGAYWFSDHGVQASQAMPFTLPHNPPVGSANTPFDGDTLTTLDPELDVSVQADGTQPNDVLFQICTSADASSGCYDSGWLRVSWPGGFLRGIQWRPATVRPLLWNTQYYWRFKVRDTSYPNPLWSPMSTFVTVVPNLPSAAHYGADAGGLDAAGVNLFLGNYVRQETDLSLPTPQSAIPLRIDRVYNSANTADGAFGAGWSSTLDASAVSPSFGLMTVTFPDGRQTNFGLNPDDVTWVPALPDGSGSTLRTNFGYGEVPPVLDLSGGSRYEFANTGGKISTLGSPDGDTMTFSEDPATHRITRVTDARSSRSLYLTWTGSHVTAVSTSPTPGSGLTWTYTYTGNKLTRVCDAEPVQACTSYTYETGAPNRLSFVQRPNTANKTYIAYSGNTVSSVSGAGGWTYERLAPRSGDEQATLLVHVTDPAGVNVYYEFDARGRLRTRWMGTASPQSNNTRYWHCGPRGHGRPGPRPAQRGPGRGCPARHRLPGTCSAG